MYVKNNYIILLKNWYLNSSMIKKFNLYIFKLNKLFLKQSDILLYFVQNNNQLKIKFFFNLSSEIMFYYFMASFILILILILILI